MNIGKTIKILVIMLLIFLILLSLEVFFMQKGAFFHPWHDEVSYNELKSKDDFEESKEYAKDVKVSPLIFTSYHDEIIDYNFSVNLSKCFSSIEELIILNEQVTHNYYFTKDIVLNRIHEYLQNRL